jgi:general secretion pathway protein D
MRWVIALVLSLLCARMAHAEEELVLNFRDAEPRAVVEAVARATGTRFIYDDSLRGQLTIVLEDKVSPAEAIEILNAALLTIGFAPVPLPAGGFSILPIEAAKVAAPWIHEPEENSEKLVTTLVRLEAANAADLAGLLLPPDRSSIVVPYAPTNSLIISAAQDRLVYILGILRALDRAAATKVAVLPLRYGDAGQVANQIDSIFTRDAKSDEPLRVVVDARTNSLVVQGAVGRVAEVRKYVELVDRPARSKSRVHVVRVMNVDAEDLAEQLRAIASERAGTRASGTPQITGRPAAAATSAAPKLSIVADEPTNSLLIAADAATFAELADVIGELDVIPPRIAIEAWVWIVDTSQSLDLGFDALLPLIVPGELGQNVAFALIGNPAPLIASEVTADIPLVVRFTRKPFLLPIIGADGTPTTVAVPSGAAQVTAAAGEAVVRNLSAPYLLAASGEEQHIFAGQNVPVPVSSVGSDANTPTSTSTITPGSVGSDFQVSQQIQRQDVGIDLRVKPVSVSEHVTSLDVAIKIDDVGGSLAQRGATAETLGPTFDQFKVEANIRLDDGAVVLMAGAPKDTTITSESKVPWLGDVPILGWLFKSVSDSHVRRRVVVAIQATQIHTASEDRAESMERALAFGRRAARVQPLRGLVTEPYALLVATRATRPEAEAILPELHGLAGQPLIVEWQDEGQPRFDVYLTGFAEIAALGGEAIALRERGFTPRLEIAGDPRL